MQTEISYDDCYLVQIITGVRIRYYKWLLQAMTRTGLIRVGKYYGAFSAVDGYILTSSVFIQLFEPFIATLLACYLYPEEVVTTVNERAFSSLEMPISLVIPGHRSTTAKFMAALEPPESPSVVYLANPLWGFLPCLVMSPNMCDYPKIEKDKLTMPIDVRSGVPGSFLYDEIGLAVGIAGSSPNEKGIFVVHPMIKLHRMFKEVSKAIAPSP